MLTTNPNIRRSNESQEAYRKRLREMHAGAKGGYARMLWPSNYLGTYPSVTMHQLFVTPFGVQGLQ